ncbi:hypothetical protein HPP92_022355 [Vanilla planifolia]|uniref:Uncharacterized protein n=1 Tax=Vanilla planifolia TaxID=51239 RepID=A0A835PQS0_VANPL|nr:hypothetical protein HPP92_022355 [Vanilla planifolia]
MFIAPVDVAATASSLSFLLPNVVRSIRPDGFSPFTLRRVSGAGKLQRIDLRRCRRGRTACRAEIIHDAPFAAAIGACILTSLVDPIRSSGPDDDDVGGTLNATDTRFAVMGIISFIPYFNWLSWVFAWLDTSRPRYLVYGIVYLAPYLRTNLSLSPDESWLPIASILICIIHIQLEANINSGNLQSFALFDEAVKLFSLLWEKKDPPSNGNEKLSKGRTKKKLHQDKGLDDIAEEKKSD